jgi:glycosyltransferase involved in cell wall biosynthesis
MGRGARYYRVQLRLVRYLRRLRPDVVQLGDVRFAGDLGLVTALRASGLTLADVCHNVRPFALAGSGAGGFGGGRIARALYRRIYRGFDVVFVHGEENRRRFVDTYGVAPGRVRAIDHGNELLFQELRQVSGTAVDAAALRRRLELPPDAPVVLALGTLARYKGLDVLVEAFAIARSRRRHPLHGGRAAGSRLAQRDDASIPARRHAGGHDPLRGDAEDRPHRHREAAVH